MDDCLKVRKLIIYTELFTDQIKIKLILAGFFDLGF